MGQDMEISAEIVEQLKLLFKEKIEGFYSRSWLREISNLEKPPILRTYTVFKEIVCLENYISCIYMKNINVLLLVIRSVPTDLVLN